MRGSGAGQVKRTSSRTDALSDRVHAASVPGAVLVAYGPADRGVVALLVRDVVGGRSRVHVVVHVSRPCARAVPLWSGDAHRAYAAGRRDLEPELWGDVVAVELVEPVSPALRVGLLEGAG